MNDQTQQTQDGGTPKQDATGTLVDQTLLTEAKPTDQTLLSNDKKTDDTEKGEKDKTSLLNEKAKDDTKKDDAAKGPPEKYEFKLPEGYQLDEKVAADASEMFKKAGLSQEQAQPFIDFYTAKANEAAEAPYNVWQETQEKWVTEIKADPEIGGKLDQVRAMTAKAIDSLGPKLATEFREAMEFTGAGNNPAFVRAFYKLAQQVTEGSHVTGNNPSNQSQRAPGSAPPSAAQAMYPELATKG